MKLCQRDYFVKCRAKRRSVHGLWGTSEAAHARSLFEFWSFFFFFLNRVYPTLWSTQTCRKLPAPAWWMRRHELLWFDVTITVKLTHEVTCSSTGVTQKYKSCPNMQMKLKILPVNWETLIIMMAGINKRLWFQLKLLGFPVENKWVSHTTCRDQSPP